MIKRTVNYEITATGFGDVTISKGHIHSTDVVSIRQGDDHVALSTSALPDLIAALTETQQTVETERT